MAVSAGTVFLPVVADTKGLSASIAAGVKSASTEVKGALGGVASNIGIALGAGAAAILAKTTQSFVDLGGQVKTLQRVTGLAAESASQLLFVGHSLGIEASSLNVAFGLLAKNIANNATNFLKYGIATRDAKGESLGLNVILGEAADKYVALGGGLAGAAFAMNVFGRSGKTLIPILALGSKGLKDMEAQAASFGVVLSQNDVDASRELAIAQRELGTAFEGLSVSVGREVVPAMTTLATAMTDVVKFVTAIPGPIKAGVLAFTALTGALIAVAKIAKILSIAWGPIGKALVTATIATYGYVTSLISLAATEGLAATASFALELALGALEGPLIPIIIGVAALGTAVALATGKIHGLEDALSGALQPVVDISKAAALAKTSGLSFAQALAVVEAQAKGTTVTLEALQSATEAWDPEKLLAETPDALAAVTDLAFTGSDALDHFAKVSGASVDSIKGDLTKLVTDAKATAGDVVSTIDDMKKAWADWHDSIVTAFGGAAGALDQFVGKNNVDFGKMKDSLQSYMDKLAQWRADFQKLSKDPASKEFLTNATKGGLEWLGILNSVADKAPKARSKFFDLFNSANKQTSSLASIIQNKLVPKFDLMIDRLTTIANLLGANITVKIDTSAASAKLTALYQQAQATKAILDGGVSQGGGTTKGGAERGAFIPGAATGGFVRSDAILHVGEKSKAEMILPLQDTAGIAALAKALERAGAGNKGSGRLHVISGRVDLDTGQIRIVAREEIDDDHSHNQALALMG